MRIRIRGKSQCHAIDDAVNSPENNPVKISEAIQAHTAKTPAWAPCVVASGCEWPAIHRSRDSKALTVRLFSKERLTPSGRWKWLVASVLAAVLIGLSCGLCESSTKAVCMKLIASSLSLIGADTNAHQTNLKKATTSRTITHSITTTSETSSNAYAAQAIKKFATSTAANMANKISDLTITRPYSTAHLTIGSSINKSRALLPMKAQLFKIYGRMVSAPSVNSTSRQLHTSRDTYLKKSTAIRPLKLTCATTQTEWRTGYALHTPPCP